MDKFFLETVINLVTQPIYKYVDNIGKAVEIIAPNMFGESGSRYRLIYVKH